MKQHSVQILTESVSRRIAAGEVIDRPHAALRELLDNAIDSGAANITVNIDRGGIEEIRVSDNGRGMSFEDLKLCWLPHATSKITSLEDLEQIRTLGFRGEALSSMAACSRLEILSSTEEASNKLSVHGAKLLEIVPCAAASGTTVSIRDLFFNMPARRRFLGSGRAEGSRCRRIFFEKAAAHPEITFRLFVDGVIKCFLPASPYLGRVRAAWPNLAPEQAWWESEYQGEQFQLNVVHVRPEFSRKDRKYIHIYANRRRIDEYSLVQAVCHAYDSLLPGGTFPQAFVFLEVDPALVDFNIHPAKKEARFRDLPAIRHSLVELIRQRLTTEAYRMRDTAGRDEGQSPESELGEITGQTDHHFLPSTGSSSGRGGSTVFDRESQITHKYQSEAFAKAVEDGRNERKSHQKLQRHAVRPLKPGAKFRYLGQIMGVFLVAESSDSLFIVDQHAAHERLLFDKLRGSGPAPEKLLFPRSLNPDKQASMRLELRVERLKEMGIEVNKSEDGQWLLTALPQAVSGLEEEIIDLIESGSGDVDKLEKTLWADLACKAAVKDKNTLDAMAAEKLLSGVFSLDSPRCPHGRPLWFEVSRKELYELVGRSV